MTGGKTEIVQSIPLEQDENHITISNQSYDKNSISFMSICTAAYAMCMIIMPLADFKKDLVLTRSVDSLSTNMHIFSSKDKHLHMNWE